VVQVHLGPPLEHLVSSNFLRPAIQTGAKVMDRLFSMDRRQAD
jgi:hypothetical protein